MCDVTPPGVILTGCDIMVEGVSPYTCKTHDIKSYHMTSQVPHISVLRKKVESGSVGSCMAEERDHRGAIDTASTDSAAITL